MSWIFIRTRMRCEPRWLLVPSLSPGGSCRWEDQGMDARQRLLGDMPWLEEGGGDVPVLAEVTSRDSLSMIVPRHALRPLLRYLKPIGTFSHHKENTEGIMVALEKMDVISLCICAGCGHDASWNRFGNGSICLPTHTTCSQSLTLLQPQVRMHF
jgi:hypothetical protein